MYTGLIMPTRQLFLGFVFVTTLITVSLLGLSADAVYAESGDATWIVLDDTSGHGVPPTYELVSKSVDSLVFGISVPGLLISQMNMDGTVFHKVTLPHEQWLRSPGMPMLPQIVVMVAAPEFEDVVVTWDARETKEFKGYTPYPSPKQILEDSPYGPYVAEQFVLDSETYSADSFYPESVAKVLHIGRIRDQKVIWLGVSPVQYNGAQQQLVVHNEIEISLKYRGASPGRAIHGTGPFESMCQRSLIGYDGVGGLGPFQSLGQGEGSLVWASDLQDCIDNSTDYLIVAADTFWTGQDSSALHEFADYRANSFGFNVSIVNVESIGNVDTSIKAFIDTLYESRSASHWWDSHLGFVLLVGDYEDSTGKVLIERHLEPSPWELLPVPDSYAADNWYASVTEDTIHPAVMLGRLPVDDGAELQNIHQKISDFEPLPDESWTRSVFLTAGRASTDPDAFKLDTLCVHDTFESMLSIVPQPEYSVSILRGDINYYEDLLNRNANAVNQGKYIVYYALHGDPCVMGASSPRSFTACSVEDLENTNKPCIFLTFACQTARFDTVVTCSPCATNNHDCIGERFVNASATTGAVAFIGETEPGDRDQFTGMSIDLFESVFESKVPVLGMAFAEMQQKEVDKNFVYRTVLLGDPALRIRYREPDTSVCDLWARSDPSLFWFDPPMDTVPVPPYSMLKAAIRNASSIGLNIPPDSDGVEVKFSIFTLEGNWEHFGTDTIRVVAPWDSAIAEARLEKAPYPLAEYDFKIEVDPDSALTEAHEDNNTAIVSKWIGLAPAIDSLPSPPSDSPTVAYLASESEQWAHYALFPCENSKVYVCKGDGTKTGAMSFDAKDGALHSPVVGDLRNDGRPVAVVASQHKVSCVDLFDADSTIWQWDGGDTVMILSPPCIADFDGNGDLEVAVAASDTADTVGLLIWLDGDGSSLHDVTRFEGETLAGCIPCCPLATADLGDDGTYDILVGTANGKLVALEGSDGSVIQVRGILADHAVAGIAVGDLNLDGSPEIVAAAGPRVRILRGDTTVERLPLALYGLGDDREITGLAVADVLDTLDRYAVEVLVSHRDTSDTEPGVELTFVRYYHDTGTDRHTVTTLDRDLSVPGDHLISRPVVGDIHSQPGQEVVVFTTEIDTTTADTTSTMWVYNPQAEHTLELLAGIDGYIQSAVLCDFEGDLCPEILFASSRDQSVWSATAGTGNGRGMEWPSVLGDERGRNIHAVCLTDTLVAGQLSLWGRYLIQENVWIPNGNMLSMAPGTELRFVPSASSPPSLICKGTLAAVGRKDAPILLTSADFSPTPGDWGGVKIASGSDQSLEHLVIEYGTYGLNIKGYGGGGPCGNGGNMAIESCEFRYNESWGVYGDPSSAKQDALTIDGCLFKNNGVGGIRLPYGYPMITDCRFLKVDSVSTGGYEAYGVKLGCSDCTGSCFDSCLVERNYFDAGPETDPDTSYWDYAIYLDGAGSGGEVIVRLNRMDSFYQSGIEVSNLQRPATITGNYIATDVEGFRAHAGLRFTEGDSGATDTAFAYSNIVYQTKYGAISDCDPPPILGDSIRGYWNTHLIGNEIGIKNDASDTLKAEMCWWGEGATDSLIQSKIQGSVDYKPWMTEDPSGIAEHGMPGEMLTYRLLHSYPNPVHSGNARIRYSVPKMCDVSLEVFNVLGQRVRVVHEGRVEPGWHEALWDLANQSERRVGPGIYFYRLYTPEFKDTKKMVVLR